LTVKLVSKIFLTVSN